MTSQTQRLERELATLKYQRNAIIFAIKVIDADYNLKSIKPKRIMTRTQAPIGNEIQVSVLEAPRNAEKQLTVGDIMVSSGRYASFRGKPTDSKYKSRLREHVR